jgi:HK97 family phage major capsid protein
MEFPKRTGLVNGGWVGEGGTASEDQSSYGEEEIFAEKLMVYSISSTEMLQDAAFNMESEINQDVAEDFAQLEGAAFVNGNGVKKPFGFLQDSNIVSSNSGVADNITGDSLIDITGELKTGYNPVYLMNRRTLADIRQLKSGDGQYLWASGLAAGQPNTLNGEPYVSMIDMPDIGAGNVPVAYGDFTRGYYIVDRVGMSMIRDDVTLATSGKIRFIFNRRVGGKVVLPEAIKTITCAV